VQHVARLSPTPPTGQISLKWCRWKPGTNKTQQLSAFSLKRDEAKKLGALAWDSDSIAIRKKTVDSY